MFQHKYRYAVLGFQCLAFHLILPATFNIETFANANINVHKKDGINSLLISCSNLNGV